MSTVEETMTGPAFIPLWISRETTHWECQTCKAIVLDGGQMGHLEWHATLNA